MEFIITKSIKVHPMALAAPGAGRSTPRTRRDRPADGGLRRRRPAFFVERLSEGIGTIAAAFYPKPVIVRMSDFKTNEYASLIGGKPFEPPEENPMIGFRGARAMRTRPMRRASRWSARAMRRVRDEMGLTNVILMIPFCAGSTRRDGSSHDGRARPGAARTGSRSTRCARSRTTSS